MFSGMRPLPLQGRHCCILSLILRPPPPTLSTKPRPPQYWHGTSTETVSSTEARSLRVIPACSAGMPSLLAAPRPRPPGVHRSVTGRSPCFAHERRNQRRTQSEYLKVFEVAEELRCSEPTVRRRIRSGELAAVKLGTGRNSAIRIPRTALDAWLTPTPEGERNDAA
jgi:excisionase family DNA binding protein